LLKKYTNYGTLKAIYYAFNIEEEIIEGKYTEIVIILMVIYMEYIKNIIIIII
jgi:hypothetical protein